MDSDDNGSTPWWSGCDGTNSFDSGLMDFWNLQHPEETDGTPELTTIEHPGPTEMNHTDPLSILLGTGYPLVFDTSIEPGSFWEPQLSTYEAGTPILTSPSSATQTSSPWGLPVGSPTTSWAAQVSPAMWENPVIPQTAIELFQSASWPPILFDEEAVFLAPQWVLTGSNPPQEPAGQMAGLSVAPDPRQNRQARSRPAGHPRLPTKDRRKLELPEKCPFCSKGHQYKALLTRHIRSNHPEILPRETFHCTEAGCKRFYTRSDRLYRHGVTKHNWVSKKRPSVYSKKRKLDWDASGVSKQMRH